ncbi:hypothetical protein VTN96DRAFT_5604 [Rasamsonia emersonii]
MADKKSIQDIVIRPPPKPACPSPFFRLHREIRLIIYEHVFTLPPLSGGTYPDFLPVRFNLERFLALLLTCRTIYWEARLIPFKANIFNLCRPLDPFWSMHCSLQLIRSLRRWQVDALQGMVIHLQQDDIVGFYSFARMSVHTHRGLLAENVDLGCPIAPLFDRVVTELGSEPSYLHMRDNNAEFKTIGPLKPGSKWSEILKDWVGKDVVLSRLARPKASWALLC